MGNPYKRDLEFHTHPSNQKFIVTKTVPCTNNVAAAAAAAVAVAIRDTKGTVGMQLARPMDVSTEATWTHGTTTRKSIP